MAQTGRATETASVCRAVAGQPDPGRIHRQIDPHDVLELAALPGIRYKRGANGQFMQSNLIPYRTATAKFFSIRRAWTRIRRT